MTPEEIYAQIPRLTCQRKCQIGCGPIGMSTGEWRTLIQNIGYEPTGPSIIHGGHVFMTCLTCPLLNPHNGECMAYDVRPLICRLWGTVKKMRCPFGCLPERWLSDQEAGSLITAMDYLDRPTGKGVSR